MNLWTITITCIVLLTSCSRSGDVRWVPKDGLSLVIVKDGETLVSSAEIPMARFYVEASGVEGTIWLQVPESAFVRYLRLPEGELIAVQMNKVTLETYPFQEFIGSGPPAIPVPITRNADGSWLSDTILNRMDKKSKQ